MLIDRLRLKGFTSYRHLVDLDLSQIDPGSLVAVTGGNGAGKTTLLEAMGPGALYRLFPSYPGSMAGLATARDAELVIDVRHADHQWVIRHQVDPEYSNGRGRAEAFLERDGEGLVDGRVGDFDQLIASYFPSREIMLASAYAAQTGAGSFFELSQADRRELFARLLGLGPMQDLAERAKVHRAACDAQLGELERRGAEVRARADRAAELYQQLAVAAAELGRAQDERDKAKARTAVARKAAADASARLDQQAKLIQAAVDLRDRTTAQLERTERQIAESEASRSRDQQLLDSAAMIEQAAAKLTRLAEERQGLVHELRAARTTEQASRSAAAAASDRIRAIRAELEQLGQELIRDDEDLATVARLRPVVVASQADADALAELRRTKASADQQVAGCVAWLSEADRKLGIMEARIADLTERAALLDRVPCRGEVVGLWDTEDHEGNPIDLETTDCGRCELLTQAREASSKRQSVEAELDAGRTQRAEGAERLAAARNRAAELEEQIAQRVADLEDRQGDRRRYDAAQARVEGHQGRVQRRQRLEQELDAVKAKRDTSLTEADAAEAKAAAIEARGRMVRDELEAVQGADERARELAQAAGRAGQYDQVLEQLRTSRQELRQSLTEIEVPKATPEVQAEADRAAQELAEVEAQEHAAEAEAQRHLEQHSACKGALLEVGNPRRELIALRGAVARVQERRSGFVLLEQAMGRTGIQALEIDAAGPHVSELANVLLSDLWGGRFTLSLQTVQAGKRGRADKEVFSVSVLDGLTASERPFDGFSGGQRVLLNEALKLAIACFNAQRSGRVFGTLWRDEADTGLSAEARPHFPGMLRRAMDLGGFDRCFVISHNQEVWEQADWRLDLREGGHAELIRQL